MQNGRQNKVQIEVIDLARVRLPSLYPTKSGMHIPDPEARVKRETGAKKSNLRWL